VFCPTETTASYLLTYHFTRECPVPSRSDPVLYCAMTTCACLFLSFSVLFLDPNNKGLIDRVFDPVLFRYSTLLPSCSSSWTFQFSTLPTDRPIDLLVTHTPFLQATFDTTPCSYFIYCSLDVSTLVPSQEIKWAFSSVLFYRAEAR